MYGTCGRIDNKADFDFLTLIHIPLFTSYTSTLPLYLVDFRFLMFKFNYACTFKRARQFLGLLLLLLPQISVQ